MPISRPNHLPPSSRSTINSHLPAPTKHIEADPTPSQKVSKHYAKRLKTAGYPQDITYGSYYFTDDINLAYILESLVTPLAIAKQIWKAPTSCELMYACLHIDPLLQISATALEHEHARWVVQIGGLTRTGYNLADNLADAWIALQGRNK